MFIKGIINPLGKNTHNTYTASNKELISEIGELWQMNNNNASQITL